jgi:RNA-splicing ligase RtcB
MVKGAEDFRCQIWPVDETQNWDTHFKTVQFRQREWRVPSWDNWKILIRSTLDSMVGSGFWIGSELFGLSKRKQDSARMKEEKEQKKREYKLKEEAKKIEKRKELGQEEKKEEKKKKKKKRRS